ncbi:hypothetical protein FSP39_019254 [Pinctada imbricata]|uniref:Fibronectin type-III domain-containing protein n=1 Tax=Pinctada imbricata TaxID=66713 RepID=A0AA89BXN2_PINIB|nr:hypothetical protein FSP39_019254 [Pinctada imbricata]
MLNFLIDNNFVVFGGKVFQQIVGIPMGTNCAPLLADIFLYSYEAEFIQSLVSEGKRYLASDFNFTYRYIDDVLSINNPKFADNLSSIYPSELEVKETTETNNSASYLDIMLSYDTDVKFSPMAVHVRRKTCCSITVHWNTPEMSVKSSMIKRITARLFMKSKWGSTTVDRNISITSQDNLTVSYTFTELIPYTEYNISMQSKPVSSMYWSDMTSVKVTTDSAVPSTAPGLMPSSFYSCTKEARYTHDGNYICILLKSIPEESVNSFFANYSINVTSANNSFTKNVDYRTVSVPLMKTSLDSVVYVTVRSYNDVGMSKDQSAATFNASDPFGTPDFTMMQSSDKMALDLEFEFKFCDFNDIPLKYNVFYIQLKSDSNDMNCTTVKATGKAEHIKADPGVSRYTIESLNLSVYYAVCMDVLLADNTTTRSSQVHSNREDCDKNRLKHENTMVYMKYNQETFNRIKIENVTKSLSTNRHSVDEGFSEGVNSNLTSLDCRSETTSSSGLEPSSSSAKPAKSVKRESEVTSPSDSDSGEETSRCENSIKNSEDVEDESSSSIYSEYFHVTIQSSASCRTSYSEDSSCTS